MACCCQSPITNCNDCCGSNCVAGSPFSGVPCSSTYIRLSVRVESFSVEVQLRRAAPFNTFVILKTSTLTLGELAKEFLLSRSGCGYILPTTGFRQSASAANDSVAISFNLSSQISHVVPYCNTEGSGSAPIIGFSGSMRYNDGFYGEFDHASSGVGSPAQLPGNSGLALLGNIFCIGSLAGSKFSWSLFSNLGTTGERATPVVVSPIYALAFTPLSNPKVALTVTSVGISPIP